MFTDEQEKIFFLSLRAIKIGFRSSNVRKGDQSPKQKTAVARDSGYRLGLFSVGRYVVSCGAAMVSLRQSIT